jgi:hypothetical protein
MPAIHKHRTIGHCLCAERKKEGLDETTFEMQIDAGASERFRFPPSNFGFRLSTMILSMLRTIQTRM